ncbi:hypothetical protein RDABS01_030841 [Bienertia sinuspersici]
MSSVVVMLAILFFASLQIVWVNGQAKATPPCLFIFGDSLSDSGNNNDLLTGAKCNFPPYGVDFPEGPTGSDHLGLPGYIKPYPKATDDVIMRGINYASGSSGILDETGWQVGDRICMNKQMERHKEIVSRISQRLGEAQAKAHLGKCLYSIYVGSNDWMFNYFIRPTVMATNLLPQGYADKLHKQLTTQIDTLLGLGAKKVMMFGLSPLGCLPILNMIQTCSPPVNEVLKMWNDKVKGIVDTYNNKAVSNSFISTLWIFSTQITYKPLFKQAECVPFSIPCQDRNERAYWDQEHTTEAANKILAARAFKAQTPTDTYPMDISSLARL